MSAETHKQREKLRCCTREMFSAKLPDLVVVNTVQLYCVAL